MTKHGKTTSLRTAKLRKWVRTNYAATPEAALGVTSVAIALVATETLGFAVSPNRVARELDRQGVPFRRVAADPPPPAWGKTELLRARQDHLEDRIRALEVKVLGKAKSGFTPRSRRELNKVLKTGAGAVPG